MSLSTPTKTVIILGIAALLVGGGLYYRATMAPAPDQPVASQTLLQYGQMCKAAIKEIPAFNCLDGDVIPITVDGVEPASYSPNMTCDRPALLPLGEGGQPGPEGQCIPYSRVLNFSLGTRQVVAGCRQKVIRTPDSTRFDEIDVISHNTGDGSTCWFQATAKSPDGLDGTKIPSPDEAVPPPGYPDPTSFWNAPAVVANDQPYNCGFCHDNDPFMYSPYIAQVWDKVPTDPQGWYKHIGPDFAWWPTVSLSTNNNPCVGCHRIGLTYTSGQAAKEATGLVAIPGADVWAETYPNSHWMPPGNFHSLEQWNTIYRQPVQDLLNCNADPAAPGCIAQPITGLPVP